MHKGFWQDLPHPIIALAPMDGVTDQPFRYIQMKYGQPDIVFTEFTSAEGVSKNAEKLFRDFLFDETQRPIVAQIFGKEPRAYYITAVILGFLGFDGIDINMGCPAKSVRQHGSGAALIRTPKVAQEIVKATRQGTQDWANGLELTDIPELKEKIRKLVMSRHAQLPEKYQKRQELPVSVKTRIGYDDPVVEEWVPTLLETEPVAITLHGRTLTQMYSGQADWEHIAKAKELAAGSDTLILGNGDISTPVNLHQKLTESGVDGVMIARAAQGNPWIMQKMIEARNNGFAPQTLVESVDISERQRAQIALEHAKEYERCYPGESFLPMRKHLAWYIAHFPFASDLRVQLVRANSAAEVAAILESPLDK